MKMFRLTFAAAAAALIMVAGIAAACGDKASTTAEKKGCCAKGAAAQTASGTSGTGCSKGAAKMAGGSGCCAKMQNTMATTADVSDIKTCAFRPGAVAFKGTVVCNHCDLKKTETCQTMFRTENGCVFTMAGDNVKQIREEAVGGKKLVRIKGTIAENGELSVSTYRIVKSLDSGASAM